jgi:hypothetical protein
MTYEEKRRSPRINSLNLLSYLCMDEEGEVVTRGVGRTLNVSKGGILLETHAPIDPTHSLSLVIAMENDLLDVRGEVVEHWVGEGGKHKTRIRFTEAEGPALDILREFIAEHGE